MILCALKTLTFCSSECNVPDFNYVTLHLKLQTADPTGRDNNFVREMTDHM